LDFKVANYRVARCVASRERTARGVSLDSDRRCKRVLIRPAIPEKRGSLDLPLDSLSAGARDMSG
jgi:hypothetical protein